MKRSICAAVTLLAIISGCGAGADRTAPPAAAPAPADCPPDEGQPAPASPASTPTGAAMAAPPAPTAATRGPSATPTASLAQLGERLQMAIDRYAVPGEYAVAVTDLQTGETVGVNGRRPQLGGCVMNLFVLMAVTREIEQGRMSEADVGGLVAATTWSSNPTTAKELVLLLGDGDGTAGTRYVAGYIASLGLAEEVVLDHPPLYREYSVGRDWNNWVTAEAMNQALALLWEGKAVPGPGRDYLLDHLGKVKPGLNYLVASVPARVSHKNGFMETTIGFVDNDAGIVRFTAGTREYAYAVTFLSQGIEVKYADVPLGQEIMRTVHSYFTAQYR